jgi:hypothetical protein
MNVLLLETFFEKIMLPLKIKKSIVFLIYHSFAVFFSVFDDVPRPLCGSCTAVVYNQRRNKRDHVKNRMDQQEYDREETKMSLVRDQ